MKGLALSFPHILFLDKRVLCIVHDFLYESCIYSTNTYNRFIVCVSVSVSVHVTCHFDFNARMCTSNNKSTNSKATRALLSDSCNSKGLVRLLGGMNEYSQEGWCE